MMRPDHYWMKLNTCKSGGVRCYNIEVDARFNLIADYYVYLNMIYAKQTQVKYDIATAAAGSFRSGTRIASLLETLRPTHNYHI